MNPPARRNPASQVSGRTTRVVVKIDGEESDEWEVVSVQRSAGGGQADQCQLVRRMTDETRTRNLAITAELPKWVEVWIRGEDGELLHPLFRGQTHEPAIQIDASESRTDVASVLPDHFGSPLYGMRCWDADDELPVTVEHDVEFNPRIDGKIIDNMLRRQDFEEFPKCNLWYLPESTRTERAYSQHNDISPLPWFLTDAVTTLCNELNKYEFSISNYEATDDDLADAPPLKNVTLKRGQHLPALLDALLPPYGYQWTLDYEAGEAEESEETEEIKPRIRVYKRGAGQKRALHCAAVGEHLTLETHGVGVDLKWNLADVSRSVFVDGAIKEREVTLPLYRAWEESDDDADIEELTKSEKGAKAFGPVWRKWVANEAGDYSGLRTTVQPIPDEPPNFDDVFGFSYGNHVIRRRQIRECLTWEDAEKTRRRPVFVEYWDPEDSEWKPLPPGQFRVLQDEIGIMFTGDTPPDLLLSLGEDAKLRITGTVQGDTRVSEGDLVSDDFVPLALGGSTRLDCSDQFFDRKRQDTGELASVLTGDADEADDAEAVEEFAEKVLDQRSAVPVQATLTIMGIEPEYQIGDIITKINGREIELHRLPGDKERCLQVVAITYDVQAQRTILSAMPYDTWSPSSTGFRA